MSNWQNYLPIFSQFAIQLTTCMFVSHVIFPLNYHSSENHIHLVNDLVLGDIRWYYHKLKYLVDITVLSLYSYNILFSILQTYAS